MIHAAPDRKAPREVTRALPLTAARLTDGALKQAQDLDAKYLLALETDRLMGGYRLRAGLEAKAKSYGGWDSVEGKRKVTVRFQATGGNEIAAVFGLRMIRAEDLPPIQRISPPEKEFFSKHLDYHGISIKAHEAVSDDALREAYQRLDMMLQNQPVVLANLVAAGAALHIIGKDQVTSDLPEHRHMKGKKLNSYNDQTVDERTRGLGGLLTSCGEENLLRLEPDRYRGRDICIHEFAHNIRSTGMSPEVRKKFDEQWQRSLKNNLWVGSYAGSNADEFFAELTMWYFGTFGDMGMKEPKPAKGKEGLQGYDPEAFALFDEFYSGRIKVGTVEPGGHRSKRE